jgi:hypothetical protein
VPIGELELTLKFCELPYHGAFATAAAVYRRPRRIMAKAKQLTVWIAGGSGELGRISRSLADAQVNVTAFNCRLGTGDSPLRLQVNQHAKARKILQDLGLRVTEEEVLRMTVADKPGTLAEITTRLSEAGIRVEYGYGAWTTKSRKADLVFAVSDLEGADRLLRDLKIA